MSRGHTRRRAGGVVISLLLWAGLSTAVSGGCKGDTEQAPAADKVPPLTDTEVARGREACTRYIERLCRCAETHPEYRKECELIRHARLDALNKVIAASESVDDAHVRWRTQVTARRIMSRCIEDDNRLDTAICPREAPPAAKSGEGGASDQ